MPTRRIIIGLAFIAALGADASLAADTSAKDFVVKIYDTYKGKDAPGFAGTTEEELLAVFEPSLAKLIVQDAEEAEKKGETPKLDGDPFVAAQEWVIETFDIDVRDAGPNKSTATVAFKNIGMPTTVTLNLVKLAPGWRIADIRWSDGSLRGLLTGK
jgi:hypothetical protein